jgi:antitoxin ParD1/3/4
MAKNTSVTLGDHFDEFISKQLHAGRYGSASEVIRAGLRALEDEETKLHHLRNMLAQSEKNSAEEGGYDLLMAELDKSSDE